MSDSKNLIETTKLSKEVYKGKLLHVFYDEAILPNGAISSREWIKHPGACAVVPVFENNDVMLIDQFRYPPRKLFLEVPAGKIDQGEAIDKTAERELLEETGLKAESLINIGHFYPAIGYANEVIHIYVARGLSQTNEDTDDDEFVQQRRIPFQKAIEMVHSGEINDGKTICCLLRVEHYLKEGL